MPSVALKRHTLPFALALVAGALFTAKPVHGLTLGSIASVSALGQPLRVVIPIALGSGETLNAACVKLVADNTAAETPQIVTGRVSVERGAAGTRLVVTTPRAVREPAVRLTVETGCGSTTRRDYVLLLDPAISDSPTAVAAADAEEAPWTRVPRQGTTSPAAPVREPVTVASALPRTTWGTPVPTGPVVPEARPKAADKAAPESKPATPAAAPASAAPRELVAVSNNFGSGGFISEAGAANLPARNAAPRTASPQSLPLTQPQWRTQPAPVSASIWQQAWPYAATIFGAIALALIALAVHRRSTVQAAWLDPRSRTSLRGETQAGAMQATFAQFGDLTEPDQKSRRSRIRLPAIPDRSSEVSELDTLLQDIQADMIDERTIKEAWKTAASESPMGIGTDSILQAIAAAERDLQIGAPEPGQGAMDKSLETDLAPVQSAPMKVRYG